MLQVQINLLAILVAAVANMVLGFLWYSPILFGKKWLLAVGKTEDQLKSEKKGIGKTYLLTFIGALVMAYVLAHIVGYTGATTISGGIQAGFWMWLGFVVTTSLGGLLFEKRPPAIFYITSGYYLVALIIMGAILAVWR